MLLTEYNEAEQMQPLRPEYRRILSSRKWLPNKKKEYDTGIALRGSLIGLDD